MAECVWIIIDPESISCTRCGRRTFINPGANWPRATCKVKDAPSQEPPTKVAKTWNFLKAVAAFIADGARTVTKEVYTERLTICDTCDKRKGGGCTICGCNLKVKARGRVFQCPLKKW